MTEATHQNPFPLEHHADVPWRKLTDDFVSSAEFEGEPVLKVDPEALELLAREAFHDISHFLRPGHLEQLRGILDDPEASANDRFVTLDLLRNSQIAAEGILPMCQDTGTAIVMGMSDSAIWDALSFNTFLGLPYAIWIAGIIMLIWAYTRTDPNQTDTRQDAT